MTTSLEPHPAPASPPTGHSIPRPLARIVPPLAGSRWIPLYGILGHVGRKSGTSYRTAIVARPTADGFVIPLPWGEATHWKQNVFAANGGTLRVGGREWIIRDPELIDLAAAWPAMGPIFGRACRVFGLRQFVRVSREPARPAS